MYSTEQIIDFFYAYYSLDKNNQEYSAAARAYLDLCRTIKFNGASKETAGDLRKQCQNKIVEQFRNLDISKTSYDKWHEELCDKIVDTYAPAGIIFNYGQAQKWVNMTMKYLLLLRNRKAQSLEKHFHIPIDSYIIEDVREDVYVDGIEPWSQMEKGKYIEYQGKLLDYVKKKGYGSPLEWEAESWNKQKEKRL